jgi:hypothetical protein
MNPETKICQNCKNDFTIESDDFSFYKKIKVPPPTLCPDCRLQRRLTWRNDWHLFKKKDAHTGETIFSIFPQESPIKIYENSYWNGDAWDPIDYGREYDFSRPFFEQFKELLHSVPLPAQSMFNIVRCQYCSNANDIKNCYLVSGASYTEDSAYVIWDQASKECFDSHMTNKCELSYGNVNTVTCYKTFFSVDCDDSQELTLCKDCVGCNSCFGSIGLRNKSHYIFNEPYSKDEYFKKLDELNLGSEKAFQQLKTEAYANWLKYPQKYIHGRQNVDVTGDYIYESKNAKDCYRVRGVEDSKFISNVLTGPVKDSYDYTNYGDNVELIYESLCVGTGASNIKFCSQLYPNTRNLTYCQYCNNSSDLFGCISLRNKSYCILNKQYSKEEYETLVPKIIEHMKTTGEYGEFFPSVFSYLPYKATVAHEFFPLEESEAMTKGFTYYETAKQSYEITLQSVDISDHIKDVDKNILDEVIECAHKSECKEECTGAFRIIQMELEFCKRMNISLPRLCPNCRHYSRLKLRNVPKYYSRACQCQSGHFHGDKPCKNEFKTSYTPESHEIVYCESCYQNEVV